jgi:DNA-binding NarL/FixJ family response regulator
LGWLKKRYKRKAPAVLVYSIYEDPLRIQAALHQGARGYVSKSASEEEIAAALEAILNNETYLEPKLAEKITEKPNLYRALTKQERAILELIQKNFDNHKIARELSLNLRTVENYLSRLYAKTGVQSRGDLVKL